jgi:hypothetical protein
MKILNNRTFPSLALGAAILSLAACNGSPEPMNVGTSDPMDAELANAAPPPPLPMIKATHTYRCKDNGLIVLDFMTDDVTVNFKSSKEGPITQLKASEAGKPFVSADGKTTIEGSGTSVTYNGSACKTG